MNIENSGFFLACGQTYSSDRACTVVKHHGHIGQWPNNFTVPAPPKNCSGCGAPPDGHIKCQHCGRARVSF